ncbi:MAG: ABC transporter permease [Bacteroidales bacterium]|nr:ABC transporter permease [Bacteroidales bacterium]
MISLNTINSVAKYERKLLFRSWFFRIFAFLTIVPLGIFNYATAFDNASWVIKAIPSSIPYMNILFLNVGQAIIAIFLASDFIKRDQKLDTSEVFMVKPMSNLEYVLGKTVGSLQMFILLNVAILLMSYIFNSLMEGVWIDYQAYIFYILILSVPTLIFIVGLSYFLMILTKNQAITFVILLGYVATTLFYIKGKVNYLFDYMGFNLPLMKSDIVGFPNIDSIIIHRLIYLLLGIGLIGLTTYKLNRLPNKNSGRYKVLCVSLILVFGGLFCGFIHINDFNSDASKRKFFISLNNKYSSYPKITSDNYRINLKQFSDHIACDVNIEGKTVVGGKVFAFCLNPGLKVSNVKDNSQDLKFEREGNILLVDFGKEMEKDAAVNLTFTYEGDIDQTLCYLDIEKDVLEEMNSNFVFNIDKQYAFLTSDFLLLTPETYWYPRPGTSYSSENPDWNQTYFSNFEINVEPLKGLVPVTQGERKENDGKYTFITDKPLQAASIVIGNYDYLKTEKDSIEYGIWIIKGHDYFTSTFDSIQDTIPGMIKDIKYGFEWNRYLKYPFKRFALVEVPVQFAHYERMWSMAQESVQPEFILVGERGYDIRNADVVTNFKNQVKWSKNDSGRGGRRGRGGNDRTEKDMKQDVVSWFFWSFTNATGQMNWSMGAAGRENIKASTNPYFLFPEIYNFRVNIYSPEWTIANRILEQYINPADGNDWWRRINGLSSQEEANILFSKNSFRDLLKNSEHRDLINDIMSAKSIELFNLGEMEMTPDEFKRALYYIVEENSFKNLTFEAILDSLSSVSGADFKGNLTFWIDSINVPCYEISEPVTTLIRDLDEEVYETVIKIKNISDKKGLIRMNVREQQDETINDFFYVEPHTAIERVVLTYTSPRNINVNTFISKNIPSVSSFSTGKVETVTTRLPREEGSYPISYNDSIKDEIIVDNEDPGFSVSEDEPVGILPMLINKSAEGSTKYRGYSPWRPPLKWIVTTDSKYYGKTVRSAHVLKSGDGSRYARWDAEITDEGSYDVYYYVSTDDERRWNRRNNAYYQFYIMDVNGDKNEISLDLNNAEEGWTQISTSYLNKGKISVFLTNKTKQRCIVADAVKFVKR